MRKSIAVILVALAGTLATPAFAITGNWVDDNQHPFVGLVVFYDSAGQFLWRCSGSLISPTKFVTAGHCADTAEGAASARVYFQQDAGKNFDPATGVDPVSGYPNTCAPGTLGVVCATSSQLFNYGFADFAGFPNTRDVGLVILDQPIALPEYGELPQAGVLNGLDKGRGKKDTVFTVSGYGLSLSVNQHSALSNISFRVRLMAQSTLVNLGSALYRRLQPTDAGQRQRARRHLLGRLRRAGVPGRAELQPDRCSDVLRPERSLPRHRLCLPSRPGRCPEVD